ncbi:tyrosine-type recombinase/integrase [Pseudomonas chlororaphis subsp. aurantiaca]|uniref:tyrosine-type recombinase/integrase n=1 Tax=Pseudomonas chlororaphis TaxID=587753 RepID=UPI0027DBECA2|nr:tyrosine-type recombinase/integrase [Pseudomonas chlororaphis]WMI99772.1 tyrosine-type recombinase/integrase [Pseudomonas chlororaphis subsp. aurantiaca]
MKMISVRSQDPKTIHANLKRLKLTELEESFTTDLRFRNYLIPLMLSNEGVIVKEVSYFLIDRANQVKGRNASNTVRTYAECLYNWLGYLESKGRVWQQANPRDLISYRNTMKAEVSTRTKRQLKSSTINIRITVVLEFYKYLQHWNSVDSVSSEWSNSLAIAFKGSNTIKLRKSFSRPRAMTQDVCTRLIQQLSGVHQLIFIWSLTTGIRTSSILSITVENYENIRLGNEDFIELIMKGGRMQKVYVPHSLRAETNGYIMSARVLSAKEDLQKAEHLSPLFINSLGGPVSRNCFYAAFKRACKKLGVNAHPHQARTTFATFIERKLSSAALNLGFDHIKIIQGLLGHASASTTQQYIEDISGNNIDVLALIDMHAESLRLP